VHDRRVGGEHLPDQVRVGDDDEDEDRPALMNTRGLTELIVLNIGLDLGLISRSLLTMLVVMALVTTFMAGPALNLLDPKRELSAPPEEELQGARLAGVPEATVPQLSIIVAPQDDTSIDALLALAEPLARPQPPRELILVRLVPPLALATGLGPDVRAIQRQTEELNLRRQLLSEHGVASRTVAFTSPDPGSDLVRLSNEQDVDLVILNGRRPSSAKAYPAATSAPCSRTRRAPSPCSSSAKGFPRSTVTIRCSFPSAAPITTELRSSSPLGSRRYRKPRSGSWERRTTAPASATPAG
jgi:hypothetical protein